MDKNNNLQNSNEKENAKSDEQENLKPGEKNEKSDEQENLKPGEQEDVSKGDREAPLETKDSQRGSAKISTEETSLPQGEGDNSHYDASNIKVLEGTVAIRQVPDMYIGDVGSFGLHHLVSEIVDNSIDEALAGFCTHIVVKIHSEESVTVIDNGRGIPVDIHPKENKSALEVITTTLHKGAKFDRSSYRVSGGLHGVGISVVNALSEKMEVEVYRDNYVYFQGYERGKPLAPVQKLGKSSNRGTKVWFKPDYQIFGTYSLSYGIISKRLRELSFLNPGVHITLLDERDGKSETFQSVDGIKAFVAHLNQNHNLIHNDVIRFSREIPVEGGFKTVIDVSFQYHDGYNETIYCYANSIHTRDGGTHLSGFRTALTRTLNAYAKKENLIKEKDKAIPTGEDWREGLTMVLCVNLPHPQFEGQTKARLTSREIQGMVETVVNEELTKYLEEHPQSAKAIINKGLHAAHVREATKKVRDLERQRKSPLCSGGLPGKLADCSSADMTSTELYLVEGDSAGGSAKSGRDRRFQAILPLKGKILNVEKSRLDKILAHNEIKMIVTALGAGIQNDFEIGKRRYGKIIIMTDADVDGSHIRTLLLTFFFRNMRPLIEEGCIYIAQPPLFKFTRKKKEQYVFSERDFQNALLEFGSEDLKLEAKELKISLKEEPLKKLIHSLYSLSQQLKILEKDNMDAKQFLAARNQNGLFPKFRYIYQKQTGYLFSENEVNMFVEQETKRTGEEIFVQEESEKLLDDSHSISSSMTNGKKRLTKREIHNSEEIARCVSTIESYGLSLQNYFTPGQHQYSLICDKETVSVNLLSEIVEQAKNIGRKGLDVQRYKGLGEMNPGQLWETTMNPETRTLLKVTMEDAAEAERLFSILMGNVVEPRRDFIEKHALEVRNLDV